MGVHDHACVLGELAAWQGDPETAGAHMDQAMRLAEDLGSAVDQADMLRTRGRDKAPRR